eukprot:Colp12_sorted_trinity150504_noHs@33652
MGIQGLAKLIADHAPDAVKEHEMKNLFGRIVAIDASMSIYQFLVAVRSEGNLLQNEAGETTSHLMGLFYRTIRMVDNGLKPLYVFDGKPPKMKSGELAKRSERREEAEKSLQQATESGDAQEIEKFQRRLVKVTPQHNEECKQLLRLMGIPYVDAPCEAEAQCAEIVKSGKAFAVGTEDMDALTFGTPVMLRHLTFSEARKMPIKEYNLPKVLEGLSLSMSEFIDLCILLGCDYCESIKGIGPHRALTLIKQHKNIETILQNLDKAKYPVPDDWKFAEARELFVTPEVTSGSTLDLKWNTPDEEGLVKFMVHEKGFSEERIRSNVKKLAKSRGTAQQGRLDTFFKVLTPSASTNSNKRKADSKDSAAAKKAKPAAGKSKGRPGGR